MKTATKIVDMKLSREELEKMTTEVKETLAFGSLDQNKIFSSVDLWNIQRHRRSMFHRKNHA